ncbi:MAG: diguanylate cyclase [Myxococcota bacterium]
MSLGRAGDGAGLRLLYVDDDADARRAVARALSRTRHHLDLAATPREAVLRASTHRYQVVLTDLHMPGTDGHELARRLASLCRDAAFVLVTRREDAEAFGDDTVGFDTVLRKPWRPSELKARLEEARRARDTRLAARQSSEHPGVLRVLVVDDDEGDRAIVESLLRVAPGSYRLSFAASVTEALRAVEASAPDAVLLNLELPDASGLDALERVRASSPDVPIIATTSHEDERVALAAVAAGAQDYLAKGFVEARGLARALAFGIERKRAEATLLRMAHHDALTGLANRVLLREHAAAAIARQRRAGGGVALAALDLDRFKQVNDTLGHEAGDALLRAVAVRLRGAVRDEDLVARLGGDEFAIVLEGDDVSRLATTVAERVRVALARPVDLGEREVVTRGSVGIAVADDGDDVDGLLRKADLAMYRVKEEGRDGFRFFVGEMQARMERELELRESLRLAIPGRRDFHLLYAPALDPRDGSPRAVEAVLTWRHLDDCSAPPLLASLEQNGWSEELGLWHLDQALAALAEAPDAQAMVSVDVGARLLRTQDLGERIVELLDGHGLAPERLELELPSALFGTELAPSRQQLVRLAERGIGLALDRFGEGDAALGLLHGSPFRAVKIAGPVIAACASTRGVRCLARAMVAAAQVLEIATVALGVDSGQALGDARALGVDAAQGHAAAGRASHWPAQPTSLRVRLSDAG